MSINKLVEPECGAPNALVRLTNQLARDQQQSSTRAPADEFADEFLTQRRVDGAHTFNMASLMRNINGASNRPHQAALTWQNEYMNRNAQWSSTGWQQEYLTNGDRAGVVARNWSGQYELAKTDARTPQLHQASKWSADYLNEFDVARNVQTPIEAQASKWTSEYESQVANSDDYLLTLEQQWSSMKNNEYWLDEPEPAAAYSQYKFNEENPFEKISDALEKGKLALARGDLSNAILLFEAAVSDNESNSEAWFYLGKAQSENEQEPAAIAALKKSLKINPHNQEALMHLSIAFTNEYMYNDALKSLRDWMACSEAYSQFVPVISGVQISSFIDRTLFERMEKGLLEAASFQPSVDANLQNAIGVLYNISGNYERSIDAFRAAVAVNPNDARAWNRLGATLANGMKSQSTEAIHAYSRALELYPGYVRARCNLGISCVHLKAYQEALEHFTSALALQQRGLGPTYKEKMSDSIWSTMRMAAINSNMSNKELLLNIIENKDFGALQQQFPNTLNITDSASQQASA